jgi:Zn-finger protein
MSEKYFSNKRCKFYPCHNVDDINCLFCFCPLYHLECDGNFTVKKQEQILIKDCSNCLIPHSRQAYEYIMSRLKLFNTLKPKRKYGLITKMSILNKKTGKIISDLTLSKRCKASSDMLVRVMTSDEQDQRVTFFMKKA